jgi:hypothetical protein
MTPDQVLLLFQLIQQLLAMVDALGDQSGQTAVESRPLAIEDRVTTSWNAIFSPNYGLDALAGAIQSVRLDTASPHIGTITDVLDAIALLTPITLPEVPPPGYGGGDLSEVWLSNLETYDWCPID